MSRTSLVRRSNARIAARALRTGFRAPVPLICECSDSRCAEIVLVDLDTYRVERRHGLLTAPEHVVERGRVVRCDDGYWLHEAA
ncbi:MAG: hypothetical protein JO186_10445 [Actinobacteria bacterium]|nr:hypothetical protein [Actinomycetota bacterium]MBV8396220.1 hypothetical protein [Actinomycetota bacterium]